MIKPLKPHKSVEEQIDLLKKEIDNLLNEYNDVIHLDDLCFPLNWLVKLKI